MDGTDSGSCPTTAYGIDGVHSVPQQELITTMYRTKTDFGDGDDGIAVMS